MQMHPRLDSYLTFLHFPSHLICLISSHPITVRLISLSHVISYDLISSRPVSSHLISPRLIPSRLGSTRLDSFQLIPSHLISSVSYHPSHLFTISSHLISSPTVDEFLISNSPLQSHIVDDLIILILIVSNDVEM